MDGIALLTDSALIDSVMTAPPILQTVILMQLASALGVNVCGRPCADEFKYTWEAPTDGIPPEFYLIDVSFDDGATWSWFAKVYSREVRIDVLMHGARMRAHGAIRAPNGIDMIVGEPSEISDPVPRVFSRGEGE